jgi:6,7-dimethyl-8-ribityllumazine synthase
MIEIKQKPEHNNASVSIAIVVSEFNTDITAALLSGALKRLIALGVDEGRITVVYVPGAIEIPLIAQRLLETKSHAAVIALGVVIRGDTNHYDYVCNQVSDGCQRVALDTKLPVVFGVLTVDNEQQAKERVGGKEGHKGIEAADTALTMHHLLQQIF